MQVASKKPRSLRRDSATHEFGAIVPFVDDFIKDGQAYFSNGLLIRFSFAARTRWFIVTMSITRTR